MSGPVATATYDARAKPPAAPWHYVAQAACYVVFAAGIGFFATAPAYTALRPDSAVLRLSVTHAGQPLKPCRRYSPEELAKLPFAQRSASNCERGRWPVRLEIDVDGRTVHAETYEPAGLWNDGPSAAYATFVLPAGRHRIEARLRDDGDTRRFGYVASREVTLQPGTNFVVDFDPIAGGFVFDRAARAAGREEP